MFNIQVFTGSEEILPFKEPVTHPLLAHNFVPHVCHTIQKTASNPITKFIICQEESPGFRFTYFLTHMPILQRYENFISSIQNLNYVQVYAENSAQEVFDKDEVFTSSDESEMDFTFLKIKLETKEGSKNNGAMSEPIRGKRPYNRKIKLER